MGLIPSPARRDSGYRDSAAADVRRLRFVADARDLGFQLYEARELLGPARRCAGDDRPDCPILASLERQP